MYAIVTDALEDATEELESTPTASTAPTPRRRSRTAERGKLGYVQRSVERVIAVDWSGKRENESEFIWTAATENGRLTELENGRSRGETIRRVIEEADAARGGVAVGLDFAFSFPRWYCEERLQARGVHDVWNAVRGSGEAWLEKCEPPFWGRAGRPRDLQGKAPLRRTEREEAKGAKSVFQIGGAGAVGTGSLRGMPYLLDLAEAMGIWPFDSPTSAVVVEIYPRLLTGKVNKGRHRDRLRYLLERHPDQHRAMLERAAGSQDAFDAAVSALVMARHVNELRRLRKERDPDYRIEGRIWSPGR